MSLFLLLLLASLAQEPDLSHPRDLPSLDIRWNWKGTYPAVSVEGNVAYVFSAGRAAALEVETGTLLWQQTLEGERYSMGRTQAIVSGDFVAVSLQDKLAVLDRRTGEILVTADLGGTILDLAGPPLAALVERDDSAELLNIDPATGEVLSRRELGPGMSTFQLERDVLLTSTTNWSEGDRGTTLAAFRNGNLEELWRQALPSSSTIEKIGGQLYVYLSSGECGVEGERSALDLSSGRLGALLPRREPGELGTLDWELQVVWSRADNTASRLRRNSPATGKGIWNRELPCAPRASALEGGTLLLDCAPGAGRGLLLLMDWQTGAIRQAAYGLRGTTSLRLSGDLVLVTTGTEILAISARQFSPPESTRPMEDEVRRVLEAASTPGSTFLEGTEATGFVDDLKVFGPDALPILSEEARTANGTALAVAARVLGDAGFRAAAPNLRSRLSDPVVPADALPGGLDPDVEILRALSRMGAEDNVPAIATVLGDSQRRGPVRRQALAALATLRTLPALRAIDETLSSLRQGARTAWRSPSPPPERDSPPSEQDFQKLLASGDFQALRSLASGVLTGKTPLPHGGSLVVFTDPALGNLDDLWMAEIGQDGKPGQSFFLGARASIVDVDSPSNEMPRLSVRIDKKILVVEGHGMSPLRLALTDIKRDSDRDGLTDLVEQRLGTDPHQPDSDGDGLKDSVDPAPTAKVSAPRNEGEEILLALFEQYFLFEKNGGDRSDLAIVVGGPALEWRGRSGPTITLTTEEAERRARTEPALVATRISIGPGVAEQFEVRGLSVGRNERAYTLRVFGFALSETLDVVMSRIGEHWFIRDIQPQRAWIARG